MIKIFLACIFLFLLSCQQKPTTALEESVDVFEPRGVLVDTRDALSFNSFHIEGSVNLLVEDFLILQNPMADLKNQKRIFDGNLPNVIERLARRGIGSQKKIYLINEQKNAIDNQKWAWLLKNLEIKDVEMATLEQFRKLKKNRFSLPERQPVWDLKLSKSLQKEFIFNKANRCFAKRFKSKEKWDEKYCQ